MPSKKSSAKKSANPQASSIDEYLTKIEPAMVDTVRKIASLLRAKLPGAEERVQWGIAIFARGGQDIAGISARKGFYSLYVPHGEIASRYLKQLGKVDAGKGCIRFKQPDDLDWENLRQMVDELGQKVAAANKSR